MKTKLYNIKVEYVKEPMGLSEKFPHYSWEFISDAQNVFQSKYRIKVIGFIDQLFWDSGWVESDRTFGIKHLGKPLEPDTEYRVVIEVLLGEELIKGTTRFRTGLMGDIFKDAKWITAGCMENPLFRKTFFTGKQPAFATVYIAARGFYELYINNKRVGDRVLAPAMLNSASIPFSCAADAYDVTTYLNTDNNTLGIMLGNGYFKGDYNPSGWTYDGEKRVWAALSIVFQDGDYMLITTDGSWICHQGPIVSSSIYHGEAYNKNLEIKGWSDPYIDTSEWKNCEESEWAEDILNTYTVPIRQLSRKKCTHLEAREDEVTFCDFKENGAGYVRIKVIGEPGTRVIITHSEHINPDGTLNTFTNGAANSTDVYILKGHELETYEPHFTYHCFRYAEIRMDGVAQLISAEKITIGADLESESAFWCDDKMLMRFYENAMRSVRSNLMSYPTDCAVNDRRLPSLMSSMAYEEFCLYSLNMQSYYRHWLKNICNEKGTNHHFPLCDGELITLPKLLAEHYGDMDIEKEMYPKMKQAVEKCAEAYKKDGFYTTFGDFGSPKNKAKEDCNEYNNFGEETGLSAAIFQLRYLTKLSEKLGYTQDKEYFSQLEEFYLKELYERFFSEESGCFSNAHQTPNFLALGMNVAKPQHREAIYSALKKQIKEIDNYRHTTGITGTRYLIGVLSKDQEGLDILSRMLHSTDYPSFGRQVLDYDATSLHEQWLCPDGMPSADSPIFGGMFADYYRIFAGITGEQQYKKINIAPKLPDEINELRCVFHSIRGKIEVYIRRISGKYHIDVVIPPNCEAEVTTPEGEKFQLGNGKFILK